MTGGGSTFRRASAGTTFGVAGGGGGGGNTSTLPPPGTRVSVHTGRLLTSTGCHPLDCVLGGGLPGASLTLLREDRFTGYAGVLQQLFLAQGLAAGHVVCLVGEGVSGEADLLSLPAILAGRDEAGAVEDAAGEPPSSSARAERGSMPELEGQFRTRLALHRPMAGGGAIGSGDRMHIAWRYHNLPQHAVLPSVPPPGEVGTGGAPYCHQFDLTQTVDPKVLARARVSLLPLPGPGAPSPAGSAPSPVAATLDHLTRLVQALQPTDYLRIAIRHFGSPAWMLSAAAASDDNDSTLSQELVHFLLALKVLLQGRHACVHLTLPAHLLTALAGGRHLLRRIEHACDAVLEVESFAGSSRPFPAAYTSQYQGLLHVHKLPGGYALRAHTQLSALDLRSLAFQVRRKRFCIDVFTLPPEEEEGGDTAAAGAAAAAILPPGARPASGGQGCAAGGGGGGGARRNPMDF